LCAALKNPNISAHLFFPLDMLTSDDVVNG